MKKFWGKKYWSESLYLNEVLENFTYTKDGGIEVDEEDIRKMFLIGPKLNTEYVGLLTGFNDKNTFEDMNSFITYSETFNVYQDGKI